MEKEAEVIEAIDLDDDDEDQDAGKPILQLFKRLINYDNKQNMILTNAQIVDILYKEFSVNLWDIHELEGEIYVTILKKYLKDWPQWDDFDRNVNSINNKKNQVELERRLQAFYLNLKDYLKCMLDQAQTPVKATVNKLIEDQTNSVSIKENKKDNVLMEVRCSRSQLNKLFFRRPNPTMKDSILNGKHPVPTRIKLNMLSLEAILNWWCVRITIQKGQTIFYNRTTMHELDHLLVNKNLITGHNPFKILPQEIQINRSTKGDKSTAVHLSQYISDLVKLLIVESPSLSPLVKFIERDLRLLPENIILRSNYRRYTNKYPYVRYMFKDVANPDISSRKYDLQLEETVSPKYKVFVGPTVVPGATVEVECVLCERKFTGEDLVKDLRAHFDELHWDEPDFKCTNCGNTFVMMALAAKWWTHKC